MDGLLDRLNGQKDTKQGYSVANSKGTKFETQSVQQNPNNYPRNFKMKNSLFENDSSISFSERDNTTLFTQPYNRPV